MNLENIISAKEKEGVFLRGQAECGSMEQERELEP
jgi:hypothetical protein